MLPVLLAALVLVSADGAEPNPPTWPRSVIVFSPTDSSAEIQAAVQKAYASVGGESEQGQFSNNRYAFLFKPGKYDVEVPVGYYTHVAGLGDSPSDVVFTSSKGVYCNEASLSVSTGALDTFWRAAEGFQTEADFAWNGNGHQGMVWAASQATSLRRVIVTKDLDLYQYQEGQGAAGYASGGFLANSQVLGAVASGSQQQFMSRNNKVANWSDGVWNMVFVGTEGAPASHCGAAPELCSHPYVTVESTPAIAEKPFITVDSKGAYSLNIPKPSKDRVGPDYVGATKVDFASVYVARAESDTAASINAKLKEGLHVVLSPGIYSLSSPLEVTSKNQVLLGLGLATLVAASGQPALQVGNVDGVRVAGILFEAGSQSSPALVEWGEENEKYAGSASNPGIISDAYARVGGPSTPSPAKADIMLRINAGHVIVDNAWLWRADHVEGGGLVRNGANPCQVAAVINGDDVTAYGFKAEHALTDQVQWNGERGQTFMFQAEMPYDVTQANFGDKGYTGYRVASNVQTHSAYGVGAYHYFRDAAVTVQSAIVAPTHLESSFVSPLAVFLNGKGVVKHIINDKGDATEINVKAPKAAVPKWVCNAARLPTSSLQRARTVWGANVSCNVGDAVTCPGAGTAVCKGNSCCPDGSTCPSAEEAFACCPSPKKADCAKAGPPSPPLPPSPPPPTPPSPPSPPPAPSPPSPPTKHCNYGDSVQCPGTTVMCAGDACCPDGSTCPSAHPAYSECSSKKTVDCTASSDDIALFI